MIELSLAILRYLVFYRAKHHCWLPWMHGVTTTVPVFLETDCVVPPDRYSRHWEMHRKQYHFSTKRYTGRLHHQTTSLRFKMEAKCLLLFIFTVAIQSGAWAEDCKDLKETCKQWAVSGFCKHTYVSYMNKNCKKSCGLCLEKLPGETCRDKRVYAKNCKIWKAYCDKSSRWFTFMKKNCKKTCELCPGKASCGNDPNFKNFCTNWASVGYCEKTSSYHDWMGKKCKKSCGLCDKGEQKKCGMRGLSSERVIGGVQASPNTWPWSVAFLLFENFFCGGSLINDQWIVTAAHCLYKITHQVEYIEAVLGEHDRSVKEGKEQKFGIEKIIIHPRYNGIQIDHDIALVKMKKKVELKKIATGNPDAIGTVCLPKHGEEMLKKSQECYIMGWGKTDYKGSSSQILMEAKMPIVTDEKCKKQNGKTVTDNMFCAGNEPGAIQSGCRGDSGGPFVCSQDFEHWTLMGVVSWGSRKCDPSDKYTVFAKVTKYVNWIKTSVKNNQ